MFIDAHGKFARLALIGCLLVGRRVDCAGIDHAFKQDRLPVGSPLRSGRTRRHVRRAPGFATRQVEDVDLRDIIAFALGRKGDAAAVGRPGRITLSRLARRYPARSRAAVGRHDPQIADGFILRIGWFAQGIDDPFAVRAGQRRADRLHHPQRLMREHLLGLGERWRGAQPRDHRRGHQKMCDLSHSQSCSKTAAQQLWAARPHSIEAARTGSDNIGICVTFTADGRRKSIHSPLERRSPEHA